MHLQARTYPSYIPGMMLELTMHERFSNLKCVCVYIYIFHNTTVPAAVPSATNVNGDVTTRKGTVSDEGVRVGVQRRAVILRLSSSRPRVCWQLQELVDRHREKCCKYNEVGRRLV
jgi:hypothetical protein